MKNVLSKIRKIGTGLIVSAVLTFMLCIYAPIELFISNQSDFWFSFSDLIYPAIILFFIVWLVEVIFLAIMRKIGELPYIISTFVLYTLLIICYIQGNFLVRWLPSLEGANVDWAHLGWGKATSIALVIGSAIVMVVLWKILKLAKLEKAVKVASAAIGALLVITFTTLCLTTEFYDKNKNLLVTDYNDFTYSSDKNLIVLVVDAIDNKEFQAALERNPEFSDTFDDFTYFDDALAGYVYTRPSMPFIVSGKWFLNETSYEAYTEAAFKESPLMRKIGEENYKAGFYSQGSFDMPKSMDGTFENYIDDKPRFNNIFSAFTMLTKMSAIRYAPWDLKRIGYDAYGYSLSVMRASSSSDYGGLKMHNLNFYGAIKDENPIKVIDDKCVRIIHIDGAHIPFQYDKNVELDPDATYSSNVDACLTICETYLKRLKESGVYDNSAIVIMGDHGFDTKGAEYVPRINPALLVKGIGEKGDEMTVSDIPVTYEDMADAFTMLLDGNDANTVFSTLQNEERTFIVFKYRGEHDMEEYIAHGKAYEFDKMEPTGKRYKK